MLFSELEGQLKTDGFTRSHNQLDDLLLRHLRPDYYCVWHFLWRELFGKHRIHNEDDETMEGNISLRDIATGAHVSLNKISRIAYFLHAIQLVSYKPGIKREQTVSHFQLLPAGIPDLEEIRKAIQSLNSVLDDEKAARADDRHFRMGNNKFMDALAKEYRGRAEVEQMVQ